MRWWLAACVVFLGPALGSAQEPVGDSETEVEAEAEVEVQVLEVDPLVFDEALADFYDGDHAQAAAGFWEYLKIGQESAENYEWAQFFLAESLSKLGFWHAATQYYYLVAKTRSRPEILPEAMRRLKAIVEERPFAESLVYEDLLYDTELGNLARDLSDWVSYVKGLYDYRNGFVRWAKGHFQKIRPTSVYSLRARYAEGVFALKNKKDDEALAVFDSIVSSELDADEVKNRAYLALARLLFDAGRFDDARKTYDKVVQTDLSFEQAELLLEKAWVAYHLKDFTKAMGLLHALMAPSYDRFFLPDAYILRGLILQRLCHFIPAKRVVRSFRFRHNRALTQLSRRLPLERIKLIRHAATQDGRISRRTALLLTLEEERGRIEDHDSSWEDGGLDAHLRELYQLDLQEQLRLWRLSFEKRADEKALALLEAEEQINLLDYEIGLDIFKRLKANEARQVEEKALHIPYDSKNVYYEFDGEYWNDELHSYAYFVNNRCFEAVAEP